MKTNEMDAYEVKAALEGGGAGLDYLEALGIDLSKMSREDAIEFSKRVVSGYSDAMKRMVTTGEMPT